LILFRIVGDAIFLRRRIGILGYGTLKAKMRYDTVRTGQVAFIVDCRDFDTEIVIDTLTSACPISAANEEVDVRVASPS